jgi:hypothetical protein
VLILWWYRGYPNAALVGFGAGHAIVTLLVGSDHGAEGRAQPGLWAGPVVAALLVGAVLLAIARAEEMRPAERLALDGKVWWVWPTVVLAIALAGQMVALSVFARRPAGYLGAGLVAALLLFLLGLRFPRYAALLAPLAAGFVTALILLVGCTGVQAFRYSGVQAFRRSGAEEYSSGDPNARTPERLNAVTALLAPALVLLLLATAYRLHTGYGIAMAALGAAVLLPWLADREPRAVGRALFGLLAAAVLFRVYYNSYDLRDNDIPLTAHYALVSLLAGTLAPFALGAFQWFRESRSESSDAPPSAISSLLFPLFSLLAAAALPCLLTLFWGQKAGGGLLLGLVIGQGYRMMTALMDARTPGMTAALAARVPEAALLLMGWVTVQLLDQIATYGLQLLRVQRVGLIAALVAVCFLAILYRTWRNSDGRLLAAHSE